MKQITLASMGLAFVTACSQQGGEQRAPAEDELTRPLEVARVDTAQPAAPVEQRSSKPPTASARPAPKKAQRTTPKAPSRRAAKPATVAEDTGEVQGYAPGTDTVSAQSDTTAAAASDTARFIVDTIPSSRIDSAVAGGDTAENPALESVATRSRDTALTTPPATRVARDSEPVSAAPTPAPAPRPTPSAAAPQPAAAPAPAATSSAAARTLPVGTEIHAALDDSINSRKDTVGRTVTAVVMENITGADGKTLIPAGAPVRFTVTRLAPARSKSAQGRIRLKVDAIGVGSELRQVTADVQPVPHELRGRGVTAGDAAKVGVGAAGGAVIGKVVGKSTEAAVIGGVVGAAGGAVVASQTATRDVFVKARTPVVLKLTQPLQVQ